MKSINNFISEALRINKNIQTRNYTDFPKTKEELRKIIQTRYDENTVGSETMNLNDIDVSAIKDFSDLFDNIGLSLVKVLDVSDWEISNATNISYMFRDLKYVEEIKVDNWNVTEIRKFIGVFSLCEKLKKIDLSNWNPRSAQVMKYMFNGCENLESIGNVSNWNLKQALDLHKMFAKCHMLKLDISSWRFNKKANKENINIEAPGVKV